MEKPLLMMAEIAEKYNFPFPTVDSVRNARNKYLMKNCFLENGVPCAKGILIIDNGELGSIDVNNIGYPCIMKPADAFSSRGVYVVNSKEEIKNNWQTTSNFSSDGSVIIEEFLKGDEVSVEGVIYDNQTKIIQITDKLITEYPYTVELGHFQPSKYSETHFDKIFSIVKSGNKSLGLNNCAFHAELKIDDNSIKIVEIGARLGGDFITSHLVPLSTGVNIEGIAIDISLGNRPSIESGFSEGSAIVYLDLPEGKIREIGNIDKLYKDESIKKIKLFVNEGDRVKKIKDSSDRSGYVIVQGKTAEIAKEIAIRIIQYIKNNIK